MDRGQMVETAWALLAGLLGTQTQSPSRCCLPPRPAQCHPGPGPAMFTSVLTEPFVYSLAVGERGTVVEGRDFGLECGSGGLVPVRCHELQERGAGSEPGSPGSRDRGGCWVVLSFRPPQGLLNQDAENLASPWDGTPGSLLSQGHGLPYIEGMP